jgi:ABC-type transport system substrate-binding protein
MYAARVTSRIFDRNNIMSTLGTDYPELDELMGKAQGSFDVAEAAAAFEDVFKVGCDDVLYIPLIDYPDMWGATEAVNYTPGVGKISRLYLDRISVN